jgi:hypothetical protein
MKIEIIIIFLYMDSTKTCKSCGATKPLNEFHKNSVCKMCKNNRMKESYHREVEKSKKTENEMSIRRHYQQKLNAHNEKFLLCDLDEMGYLKNEYVEILREYAVKLGEVSLISKFNIFKSDLDDVVIKNIIHDYLLNVNTNAIYLERLPNFIKVSLPVKISTDTAAEIIKLLKPDVKKDH